MKLRSVQNLISHFTNRYLAANNLTRIKRQNRTYKLSNMIKNFFGVLSAEPLINYDITDAQNVTLKIMFSPRTPINLVSHKFDGSLIGGNRLFNRAILVNVVLLVIRKNATPRQV